MGRLVGLVAVVVALLGAVQPRFVLADESSTANGDPPVAAVATPDGAAPTPVDLLPRGKAVYAEHCASCHGDQGEGVDGVYETSLIGDKSVRELSGYIGHAMPEGSPEDVTGADADAVSRYIYDSFYSPLAQERLRPARVRAARLTSRQFEHSLADVLSDASWLMPALNPWRVGGGDPEQTGLLIRYVDGGDWKGSVETNIDRLQLTFGKDGPKLPEGMTELKDDVVRVYVRGAVIAPETGFYELAIECNGAFELAFNEGELLNVRTRSEGQDRHAARVRMLAGRPYPIRLEARLPVVKNRKKGEKQPVHSDTSNSDDEYFLRLKWTPPHGVEQIVPLRCLFRNNVPPTFVASREMPPDDRSTGYVTSSDISEQWVEAAAEAALQIGDFAATRIRQFTGAKDDAGDRNEKVAKWLSQIAERAWRRPLGDEAEPFKQQCEALADELGAEEAVRRTLVRVVLSPRFLYRELNFGEMDTHDVASFLSFTLLDTVPTPKLREMARNNQLKEATFDWLLPQVLDDVRAKAKFRDVAHTWLHVDQFGDLSKSPQALPEFNDSIEQDLRLSLDLFLDEVVWGEQPNFRRLMTSSELWLNPALASMYGGQVDGDVFRPVTLEGQQRAGLLSHPYLMAGFSYDAETSPIHRGVFLSRSILGRLLKPPPIAVAPLSPDLEPHLTQRERVALQTEAIACQSCHGMINPLGFSLEHFDALGRRREQAGGREVDASGRYINKAGDEVQFADVTDLAAWVADSREAHEAFVEQVFQYLVNQPVQAFGPEMLRELTDRFEAADCNIRTLIADCARVAVLRSQSSQQVAAHESPPTSD